jgi:hypothetical protein
VPVRKPWRRSIEPGAVAGQERLQPRGFSGFFARSTKSIAAEAAPTGDLEKPYFARHSSESWNPVPLFFNALKTLDPSFRWGDGGF